MNVNTDITARFSPKAFTANKIDKADLYQIFEAARWAPSAYNEQPWRFVYAENGTDEFNKFVETLASGNQVWAKNAAVLVLTAVNPRFKRNNKANPHAWHDLGQAVANLSLAAWQKNIGVHQMAGFNAEKAKEVTNAPEEYEMVSAIALGYFKEQEKERKRLDLDEILIENQF